jgi:uncharacterized protein YbcV (DUF1398 family)
MFTIQQINKIHDELGNADTLPAYLHALDAIGVVSYDSFISDGHSQYFGADGSSIVSKPIHETFEIATACNEAQFKECLKLSEAGAIGYLEMSQRLAESGIEKWTFDTGQLTITYFDLHGEPKLTEDLNP